MAGEWSIFSGVNAHNGFQPCRSSTVANRHDEDFRGRGFTPDTLQYAITFAMSSTGGFIKLGSEIMTLLCGTVTQRDVIYVDGPRSPVDITFDN